MFYQLFNTLAAGFGPVRLTTVFLYVAVIFSLIFDWLIWQHVPQLTDMLGIFMIIMGGVLRVVLYPEADQVKTK